MNRLLLCSIFMAAGAYCRASVILSINPPLQTVSLGSQISLEADVSGLGGGTSLGTYDLNVGFDPSVLSYSSISFGSGLDILGLGDIQSVLPGGGNVEVFELSLDSASDLNSLQAPSFRLFTLTFGTLAASTSPIALSINAVGDASGTSISAALQNGSVTVSSTTSSTPEPSTFALLGIGGFGALIWRRRKEWTGFLVNFAGYSRLRHFAIPLSISSRRWRSFQVWSAS